MDFGSIHTLRSSCQEVLCKKGVLIISQNHGILWRNLICNKAAKSCNFIKKEALALVFTCDFANIFKNTFFYRTPPGDCFNTFIKASTPFSSANKNYLNFSTPIEKLLWLIPFLFLEEFTTPLFFEVTESKVSWTFYQWYAHACSVLMPGISTWRVSILVLKFILLKTYLKINKVE